MDTKRHAPTNRRRIQFVATAQRRRPHMYAGGGWRRAHDDIFVSDHADGRRSGRFRWLLSTCLAAAVGVLAILVVIASSTDQEEGDGRLLPIPPEFRNTPFSGIRFPSARVDGLRWAIPKTDRLVIPSGAVATKSIILDAMRQHRGNRDYIVNRPYARLAARLAPVSRTEASAVPVFNPFKLYANTTPLGSTDSSEEGRQDAAVKILELPDGMIPNADGQEFTLEEILDLVARVQAAEQENAGLRPGFVGGEAGGVIGERFKSASEQSAPFTSYLQKTMFEADEQADDLVPGDVRVLKAQRGDTIARLLQRLNTDTTQIRAITEAARSIFPDAALGAGYELHATVVPSVARPGRLDVIRLSVFGEEHSHKLTVIRNGAGEFAASSSPVDDRVARQALAEDAQPQASSLYASVHYTASKQGIPDDVILQILRVHAYETDFRQRVRPGDSFEFFFAVKEEEKGFDGSLGELLETAITSSGETHRFYRFRTQEGVVDYYDEQGNTSRKFLMRRPVRGEDVRITSGFGVRRHPILQVPKMHTGVDWACAMNTPIMAAGSGVIEEAGRKGEYGNYIRIRHANGYKTAYGHMARFAPGVAEGVKVRQGQIIGFVGTTGLSSGPHVHFEVLVNNNFVDPMSIQVPRERQLTGKELAEFQKERTRIDELLRRNPISTKVATLAELN